jgi:phenylacetate-CoA ligase
MNTYFNESECSNSAAREKQLLSKLASLISYAQLECSHYRKVLGDIDSATITSREALAKLPITRKSDLISLQKNSPVFGGLQPNNSAIQRIFQSPGPIYDPESTTDDWWRVGQAFYAAGFRKGDVVQNCLSYHLTPGGFILDSGARACGCVVIPAGPGQTEQQLDIIEDLKPQGYCGTPSFLKILLDKARESNRNISSISKALVTGEALPPALRTVFIESGINVLQAYASADIGLIGYESIADDGLIISEDLLVEVVRPGSLDPVTEGEIGEVVVTSFNPQYPLIRFATGDLSAVKSGNSACGRTNMRIKGWMGRADQTTKVKGMFVHPEQLEKLRLKYKNIDKLRLLVNQINHNDQMHLQCEFNNAPSGDAVEKTIQSIQQSLKEITKLNGTVEILPLGNLPNDGKVIDDLRPI